MEDGTGKGVTYIVCDLAHIRRHKLPSFFIVFVSLLDGVKRHFHTIFQLYRRDQLPGILVEETGGPGENHRPVASH